MKIFQFKRKNSQNNTNSPALIAGEMFVFPSEEKIRIGKQEDAPTNDPGTYFEIKSKLNLGDTVYNANDISSGYSIGQTFVGISGSGTNFSLVRMNGQQVPLNVTISSTAEYAKYLVTSGSNKQNTGDVDQPVYFSGGKPTVITKTTSSTKITYFDNGKIKTNDTAIGGGTMPLCYTSNGFAAINSLPLSWRTTNLISSPVEIKSAGTSMQDIITASGLYAMLISGYSTFPGNNYWYHTVLIPINPAISQGVVCSSEASYMAGPNTGVSGEIFVAVEYPTKQIFIRKKTSSVSGSNVVNTVTNIKAYIHQLYLIR